VARNQEKIKGTFDHKARERNFEDGDLVLVWDKGKKSQECTRSLIVYGSDPIELRENPALIPSFWPHLRERSHHYLLMGTFSNPIFRKELYPLGLA
jgi:hypothetical protein